MAESRGNGGVLMMILGLLHLLLTLLLHVWCCLSHLPFSLPIISSFPPASSFWINLWSYQSLDQNLLWRLVVYYWAKSLAGSSVSFIVASGTWACVFLPLFPEWVPVFLPSVLSVLIALLRKYITAPQHSWMPFLPSLLPSSSFPTCSQTSSHSSSIF